MRVTVMGQMVKGMTTELKAGDTCLNTAAVLADLVKHLESVTWNLWHGKVLHALQRIDDLNDDLELLEENPTNKNKLKKAVQKFPGYIEANQAFIPNYGDRYRHHETISTAFVESAVNYVVSKRFVKKQQMRWTQRGAHLLLQTRVQVLNHNLWENLRSLVPRIESRRAGGTKGGRIRTAAPGMVRSPYCCAASTHRRTA